MIYIHILPHYKLIDSLSVHLFSILGQEKEILKMVAIKCQQQLIRDGETALLKKYILYCQAMCTCGGCYIF